MRHYRSGGVWRVLQSSEGGIQHTGNTNETVLVTLTLPPLGANSKLKITSLWSFTNTNGTRTERWRLGGIGGTAMATTGLGSTLLHLFSIVMIGNDNSQSVQKGTSVAVPVSSATAATTGAINTAVATELVITTQLASAADVSRLNWYIIELLR